jgi:hypothetical protein
MQYTAQDDRTSAIGHLSNGVLASLQKLIAGNNADADATQARLHALEQAPWRSEKMRALDASGMLPSFSSAPAKTAAQELAEARAQIELLERKLAAANAELMRCRTQLYAYEREIRALLEESTALEAELESAQERGLVPNAPPPPDPLLDLDDPSPDNSAEEDAPPAESKPSLALYIAQDAPSSSSPLPRAAAPGAAIRSLNV